MDNVQMNLAFTLCSNNYLAQAKTLGDSFLKHHPETQFVIGLVDAFNNQVDYKQYERFTLITVESLKIPDFQSMVDKFNIIELNTAVKPYFFSYLFQVMKADKIVYLDPDIQVFSPLVEVFELLNNHNIVITPQLCEPIDDGHSPTDQTLLITGTFNLGFIALSHFDQVTPFLSWWTARIVKYGFAIPEYHMFYDQLYINLVPAYFDNYFILRNKGYNMAGWNMHERAITTFNEQEVIINGSIPLRFFHYSGYKFTQPEVICKYNDRYNFVTRPDVKKLFNNYQDLVIGNNYQVLNGIEPVYKKKVPPFELKKIPGKIFHRFRRTTRVLFGIE